MPRASLRSVAVTFIVHRRIGNLTAVVITRVLDAVDRVPTSGASDWPSKSTARCTARRAHMQRAGHRQRLGEARPCSNARVPA